MLPRIHTSTHPHVQIIIIIIVTIIVNIMHYHHDGVLIFAPVLIQAYTYAFLIVFTMAKSMLAPASHSADSHRADRVSTDTMVALLSYNVGIQNAEVAGQRWQRKYDKLKNDLQAIFFNKKNRVHILLISEFGNMFGPLSNAQQILSLIHITEPTRLRRLSEAGLGVKKK